MGMRFVKKVPSPAEIIDMMPLSEELAKVKQVRDEEVKNIITGSDSRMLLIVGPCSADNEDSVCDYISRIAKLQGTVSEKLILIPRIYTNKPRTTGEGYKGMVHQPDPEKAPDLYEGIKAIRRLHIRALREYGLPAADEMLYPSNYLYLADVLGYHAIGARSVEDQLHRLTVSGVDAPVGMKNPTSGDLQVLINSIKAAQSEHSFIYNEWETKTSGNPLAHAVLRGSSDFAGRNFPNYHFEDLYNFCQLYLKSGLCNPAIIVDTNHSNSGKRFFEQPRIAHEVMQSRQYDPVIKKLVKGFMIESYIEEGAQSIGENVYGKSITDACIGWNETVRMVNMIAEMN